MIHRVLLVRHESHEAAVELEASSPAEAERMARERAEGGMIAWVRVHQELDAEVDS